MKMNENDKALYQAIDEILWRDWDPIGVNDNEDARNEYQSYTPHIFSLRKQGADIEIIAQYLYQSETISMGITGNKELALNHCKAVAQKILNL